LHNGQFSVVDIICTAVVIFVLLRFRAFHSELMFHHSSSHTMCCSVSLSLNSMNGIFPAPHYLLMWFCSSGLKTSGCVLLLVLVTCFFALLSVNSDMIIFHYLFAGFNCVQVSHPFLPETLWMVDFCMFSLPSSVAQSQGPFVFFFRIVFNKEARNAMKYCCSRKRPDHMIKSKASVSPSSQTLRNYSLQSNAL